MGCLDIQISSVKVLCSNVVKISVVKEKFISFFQESVRNLENIDVVYKIRENYR